MKMSFFIKNKGRGGKGKPAPKRKFEQSSGQAQRSKKKFLDEHIDSESDIESDEDEKAEYSSSEEEETAQEKKLRLAKKYLSELKSQDTANDDEDIDDDAISKRLHQDQLEQSGKLQRKTEVEAPNPDNFILFRGHQLSVTCVVISQDNKFVYSASKDCSIIKWSLKERKRVQTIHGGRKGTEGKHIGHTSHVLVLALSSDGKYLASGDVNKLIHIWDGNSLQLFHTFKGHRQAISGLSFRRDTHQLYSCSHDRAVKVWNVGEKSYVETLFGHENKISGIDSLTRERAITAGGQDSSVRVWKISEESQLVFNAHSSCSVDCVALLNEQTFVTGADDNSISLWSVLKKKPVCTVKNAHSTLRDGPTEGTPVATTTTAEENWITCVAALHNSDLIASGSKDGCIRLWKCTPDHRKFVPLFSIPCTGFVNSLQFSRDGRYLVAGVGQEHKLGRWWSLKQARNSVCIIPLNVKLQ